MREATLDPSMLSRQPAAGRGGISSDYDLAIGRLKTASEKQNIDATAARVRRGVAGRSSPTYDLRGVPGAARSRVHHRRFAPPVASGAIFKAAIPALAARASTQTTTVAELLRTRRWRSMVQSARLRLGGSRGQHLIGLRPPRAIAAVLRPARRPKSSRRRWRRRPDFRATTKPANLLIEIVKAGLLTDRTSHAFVVRGARTSGAPTTDGA